MTAVSLWLLLSVGAGSIQVIERFAAYEDCMKAMVEVEKATAAFGRTRCVNVNAAR